jgi:L-iditol 2-dehydrogenase
MLAALLYGKENLQLETVDDPTPGIGEVAIKVGVATTCGTDLKVWRRGGHAKMLPAPTLFGHEVAGSIIALGEGVTGWEVAIALSRIIQPLVSPVFFVNVKSILYVPI